MSYITPDECSEASLNDVQDYDSLWDAYSEICQVDFPEKEVAERIYVYASPVFLVIGTIGNILSAIVLFNMCIKVLTTCMYLFVITIIDLIVLYLHCGTYWLLYLAEVDVASSAKQSSNSMCKIYPFVKSFTLHLTIWLLVAMATETTIVTLRPERMLRVCVMERARAVILLIIVLLVCVNAHCFWTFALNQEKPDKREELCTNHRQGQINEEFRKIVWPIIDILVTHFFPYFTIFSCTVIIVTRRVKKKATQERGVVNTWKAYPLDAVAAKQFQTTIVTICIAYLILMIPRFAAEIFTFLVQPEHLYLVSFSFKFDAKVLLAGSICHALHYTFICCKFFIFVITSRKFREELRRMLTCHWCRRRPSTRNTNARCLSNRAPSNYARNNSSKIPMLENNLHNPAPLPYDERNQPIITNSLDVDEKKAFAITSV